MSRVQEVLGARAASLRREVPMLRCGNKKRGGAPHIDVYAGEPDHPDQPWSHPPVIGDVASPPAGGLRWGMYPAPDRVTVPTVAQRASGSLADADYHKSSAFGPRYWSPGQSK